MHWSRPVGVVVCCFHIAHPESRPGPHARTPISCPVDPTPGPFHDLCPTPKAAVGPIPTPIQAHHFNPFQPHLTAALASKPFQTPPQGGGPTHVDLGGPSCVKWAPHDNPKIP